MSNFIGQEIYSLDPKNRVSFPAKMLRHVSDDANDTFIVTLGRDGCIVAYPKDKWKKQEEFYANLDHADADNIYFLRLLSSHTEIVQLDIQHRVMLPPRLTQLENVKITGKVLILGIFDHVEFWNPENYDKYIKTKNLSFEEAQDKVKEASKKPQIIESTMKDLHERRQ